MEVIISDRPELIAADIIESYARDGKTLGLATGSTPLKTYAELVRRHREGGLSFAKCQAFLLDEYVGLPRDHEQSYYETIRREFTRGIDIADDAVHSPDGLSATPESAGGAYDEAIKAAGGVDMQLLGVGSNGHIGFNEPGSSLASRTRLKTLHPQTIRDNARFFDDDEAKVPRHVLTQGLGTILEAGHLLLIATGAGKADAVSALVEGPVSAFCPASVLQLHQHATVLLDEQAASKLKFAEYYRFAAANKPEGQWY